MSKWLDDFRDGRNVGNSVADGMRYLAGNFAECGNTAVARKLNTMAKDLEDSLKLMDDAIGANINESYKASQQSTATMISAVFAGMEVQKRTAVDCVKAGIEIGKKQ